MAEKDLTEKTLEAFEDVFADIVNGFLFGGRSIVHENSLTEAQQSSHYTAGEKMHEQRRDVAKYWISGKSRKGKNRVGIHLALFGIENQTKYDKDMPLRVIGYDGAAYRAQLSGKERYPVVTIVLYFGKKAWGKNRALSDVVKIPEFFAPYVNDYRINIFEVSQLPKEMIELFHSDFKVVLDFLIQSRGNPDYRPDDSIGLQPFRHADELLNLMTALTGDIRYTDMRKGDRPKNMCEVLDRAEAKGREEGIKEGEQAGGLKMLSRLLEKGLISLEDASREAGMPSSEFLRKTAGKS